MHRPRPATGRAVARPVTIAQPVRIELRREPPRRQSATVGEVHVERAATPAPITPRRRMTTPVRAVTVREARPQPTARSTEVALRREPPAVTRAVTVRQADVKPAGRPASSRRPVARPHRAVAVHPVEVRAVAKPTQVAFARTAPSPSAPVDVRQARPASASMPWRPACRSGPVVAQPVRVRPVQVAPKAAPTQQDLAALETPPTLQELSHQLYEEVYAAQDAAAAVQPADPGHSMAIGYANAAVAARPELPRDLEPIAVPQVEPAAAAVVPTPHVPRDLEPVGVPQVVPSAAAVAARPELPRDLEPVAVPQVKPAPSAAAVAPPPAARVTPLPVTATARELQPVLKAYSDDTLQVLRDQLSSMRGTEAQLGAQALRLRGRGDDEPLRVEYDAEERKEKERLAREKLRRYPRVTKLAIQAEVERTEIPPERQEEIKQGILQRTIDRLVKAVLEICARLLRTQPVAARPRAAPPRHDQDPEPSARPPATAPPQATGAADEADSVKQERGDGQDR